MSTFIHYRRPDDDFEKWQLVLDGTNVGPANRQRDEFGAAWDWDEPLDEQFSVCFLPPGVQQLHDAGKGGKKNADPRTPITVRRSGEPDQHLFYVSGDHGPEGPRLLPAVRDPGPGLEPVLQAVAEARAAVEAAADRIDGKQDETLDRIDAVQASIDLDRTGAAAATTKFLNSLNPTVAPQGDGAGVAAFAQTVRDRLDLAAQHATTAADAFEQDAPETESPAVLQLRQFTAELEAIRDEFDARVADPGPTTLAAVEQETAVIRDHLLQRARTLADSVLPLAGSPAADALRSALLGAISGRLSRLADPAVGYPQLSRGRGGNQP
jgi:hypothetical protein